MSAVIIAFPSGAVAPAQPEVTPTTDFDDFTDWYEANVPVLVTEISVLEGELSASEFWDQAAALRDLLNSWPIPHKGGGDG